MAKNLKLPYVKHRSHSNSSFERQKQRKLEKLSIPPRAQIPAFLVGEQTPSLFKPLEYDLAQTDNRDANINRSPSRTGSLTSGIYGELPLSAVCGSSPTSPLYDKSSPLTSPRPQFGESMELSPQVKATSPKVPKSLSKMKQTLGSTPGIIQEGSTFSDTSSDYSQWTDNNRDSMYSNPRGLSLQPPLSPTSHPTTTAKVEKKDESVAPKSPIASSKSILSPFITRPPPFANGYSAELKNSHKENQNRITDVRPDLAARSFSDEDTQSLKDILGVTEENHTRWLAVNKLSSPPSIKQHDEVLHSYRKDCPLPSSNTLSKHRQPLTISTEPPSKRVQVTWSPSIPKRASALLGEARESFKRGVDELSSPSTSRSGPSFFLSPSIYTSTASEYSISPSTPNTALTPFPNCHSSTRSRFPPSSPIPEEKSYFEHEDKTSELRSIKWATGKNSKKRFKRNAKPHPNSPRQPSSEKGSPKDALSTIVNTAMRISSLASSRNEKERKNSTSIITNYQRSGCGPDTPFPRPSRPNTREVLSPVASPAYGSSSALPTGSPSSGLVGNFRHAIGVKTKEERLKIEAERLREEKEARRKYVLGKKGIRLIGEVVHKPGSLMDGIRDVHYPVLTSLPISLGSAGAGPGERTRKPSTISGVDLVSSSMGNKMNPEGAKLHVLKSPHTFSNMQMPKAPSVVPAKFPLPASPPATTRPSKASKSSSASTESLSAGLPRSAVNTDGTTWL